MLIGDETHFQRYVFKVGNGMYLYADGAKLFCNNVDDLQSALDRLSVWLCSCQLR